MAPRAAGCTDVLVVERAEPTSGSTFHSAGLVGQLRSSLPLTQMMMHSVDVYRALEADAERTGRSPGWREVGSLRIASTEPRMEELRRQHGWAKTFGLPMELLGPREARERFPLMDPKGCWARCGCRPTATSTRAASRTRSSVAPGPRGERRDGCPGHRRLAECAVEAIGVVTDHGTVRAETVVVACGMYTPEGRGASRASTCRSSRWPTSTSSPSRSTGVTDDLPQLRDPDNLVYFRRESGGLVLGGYERDPAPWSLYGVPDDFNNKLLPEDWDRFAPLMTNACFASGGRAREIVRLINGPEGFTPDNEFVLGESEVHGLFVAAGFCAHGIAGAGGVGRVMAEWILDGEPSFDTWKMDIRRFGAQYRSREFALARAVEVYSTYYDIHYPERGSDWRGDRCDAPPPTTASSRSGAFGEKSMWERPNWFEPNAAHGDESMRPRGGRASTGARRSARRRSRAATRSRCSTRPASRSSSSRARGGRFPEPACANEMDQPVGSVIYTQLCNERGGIECDLTATRIEEQRYLLVTGTAFGNHDLAGSASSRSSFWRATPSPSPTSPPPTAASGSGDRWRASWRRSPGPVSTTTRSLPHSLRITVGSVPVDRGARHLRGRARLGALLPDGVRRRAVGRALGRRSRARHARRRLPRDRRAPRREGLPGLVERHHARRQSVQAGLGFAVKL